MLRYEWFAERYRWTEAEVDEASLAALEWFPVIAEAKAEVARMRQKEAERDANKGHGRR